MLDVEKCLCSCSYSWSYSSSLSSSEAIYSSSYIVVYRSCDLNPRKISVPFLMTSSWSLNNIDIDIYPNKVEGPTGTELYYRVDTNSNDQ
jgi:hypothetical protein